MDPRQRRSRDRLRQGLAQLLREKAFEDIQIHEITQAADVAISTFYRHYPNKLALLADVLVGLIDQLETQLNANPIPFTTAIDLTQPSPLLPLTQMIEADRDFFKVLVQTTMAHQMFSMFLDITRQKIRADTPEWTSQEVELMAGNIVGNVYQWLLLDLPYDAEHMANLIHRSSVLGLMGLRGQLDRVTLPPPPE